ncbi:hypothetical protein N0V94_006023 [Neodidymelliopsis sp. IMI 364377]|nr:hypothetical protein N0V94_006023 [Neodidymelliopsis sp. IMI 364377]
MSTRNLLRHVFRHSSRAKVADGALPLDYMAVSVNSATNYTSELGRPGVTTNEASVPHPKTPEPSRLEDITEEEFTGTHSPTSTISLAKTLNSFDLEISNFSTRELICAALDEARTATLSHLDTIETTLALLGALNGFSATISELEKDMMEKKQACIERVKMLEAVDRAVESMTFNGEV